MLYTHTAEPLNTELRKQDEYFNETTVGTCYTLTPTQLEYSAVVYQGLCFCGCARTLSSLIDLMWFGSAVLNHTA